MLVKVHILMDFIKVLNTLKIKYKKGGNIMKRENKKANNKRMFKVIEKILQTSYYEGININLEWYEILDNLVKENKIDKYIERYFITKSASMVNCDLMKNSPTKKLNPKSWY